ncbi:MAG: cell division protein ZapA [Acetobacteraceae bacterium]|nr:cell division protein ZapA [Acetobacteraceae bacterium]
MAQVTLRINGYAYPVGCEDGQEEHLQAMAQQVEDRIARVKKVAGQSGESRLLVLAALLMADELHDLGMELRSVRASKQPPRDPAIGRRLAQLAEQAEGIAAKLDPA